MGKNLKWPITAFQAKDLIEVDGTFVKASSQVIKGKVDKLPNLIERAMQPQVGDKFGNNKSTTVTAVTKGVNGGITLTMSPPTGNKKIKNATRSTNDAGISFDSNLERYMYGLLIASKIDFEFQKTFELQGKFKYRDEAIRGISKVVDFYLPTRNIIIDTKGYENDISPMKHKMLKSVLKHLHDMQPEIIMPRNKKECDTLLNKLLYGN